MRANKRQLTILFVSHSNWQGGAGRMFHRLAENIEAQNINIVTLNVDYKNSPLKVIKLSKITKFCISLKARLAAIILRLLGKKGPRSLNIFNSPLLSIINASDADLVHLHWINGETLSIADIANINKPIVWTFHDMWPLTGSEHAPENPYQVAKYKKLNRNHDLDNFLYRRKTRYWTHKKFHIISPSQWLAAITAKTEHFKNSNISVIPNGIDTSFWRPIKKNLSSEKLSSVSGKKRIMFGVFGDLTVQHKGFDLFKKAIFNLEKISEYQFEIILVGKPRSRTLSDLLNYEILSIPEIQDSNEMIRLYNWVDVVVIPSRLDNFPTMALEANSCGTPVAGFDNQGLAEIVIHSKTGYLARPFCPTDLAKGINYCISNFGGEIDCYRIAEYCSKKFDIQTTAKTHIDLYQEILKVNE